MGPPAPRTLEILWKGVKFVMENRALRAETWGDPQVLNACNQELRDLKSVEKRSFDFIRHLPKSDLQYPYTMAHLSIATRFLLFWSEHILDLGRLGEQETNTWAWGMVHKSWPGPPYV
jgi:hypothetical protein